jgi:hypothetical protein
MFSLPTKLNISQWTRRLKILSTYNYPSAHLSTTTQKCQAIKVELDNDLEENLAANKLRVNKKIIFQFSSIKLSF